MRVPSLPGGARDPSNAGPEWAGSGKQDWRCGTNRQPDQGAQVRADPENQRVLIGTDSRTVVMEVETS